MARQLERYIQETLITAPIGYAGAQEGDIVTINTSGQLVLAGLGVPGPIGMIVNGGVNIGDPASAATNAVTIDPAATYTVGARIWPAASGGITQTSPATAGDVLTPIGIALTAQVAIWDFAASTFVYQAAATSTVAQG